MARVYVGMGSNIDPEAHVRQGLQILREVFGEIVVSPVYESAAVGFVGDRFYNLVVGFDTRLDPRALEQQLHEIEYRCGRQRGTPRFSSRALDLDLLLYDDLVVDEEDVKIPRGDILEYAFVLRPLADIAGELEHPVAGQRIAELWQDFGNKDSQELRRVELTL
jgi:2-amino-4-hydroxy-6-hydroxymethyldihydropteridine diphosphokinase